MTDILDNLSDLEVLSLTLYGESRGEKIEGQVAVGCVIRNRMIRQNKSYSDVCLQRFQFSCWNENDPNRAILLELGEKFFVLGQEIDDKYLKQCVWVAEGIMTGVILDNTKGATHYMTWDLFNSNKKPSWAKTVTNLQTKGNQVFFNV